MTSAKIMEWLKVTGKIKGRKLSLPQIQETSRVEKNTQKTEFMVNLHEPTVSRLAELFDTYDKVRIQEIRNTYLTYCRYAPATRKSTAGVNYFDKFFRLLKKYSVTL